MCHPVGQPYSLPRWTTKYFKLKVCKTKSGPIDNSLLLYMKWNLSFDPPFLIGLWRPI